MARGPGRAQAATGPQSGGRVAGMTVAIRLLPLCLALLAGCAAPPPAETGWAEDCAAQDWRAAGRAEAEARRGAEAGLARIDACPFSPASREAARGIFLAGHEAGTRAWCTPETGRELGRRGEDPTLACPPDLAPAFDRALAQGRAERAMGPFLAWDPVFLFRPILSVGVGSGGVDVGGGVGVAF